MLTFSNLVLWRNFKILKRNFYFIKIPVNFVSLRWVKGKQAISFIEPKNDSLIKAKFGVERRKKSKAFEVFA